jgi:hypothetical protein
MLNQDALWLGISDAGWIAPFSAEARLSGEPRSDSTVRPGFFIVLLDLQGDGGVLQQFNHVV